MGTILKTISWGNPGFSHVYVFLWSSGYGWYLVDTWLIPGVLYRMICLLCYDSIDGWYLVFYKFPFHEYPFWTFRTDCLARLCSKQFKTLYSWSFMDDTWACTPKSGESSFPLLKCAILRCRDHRFKQTTTCLPPTPSPASHQHLGTASSHWSSGKWWVKLPMEIAWNVGKSTSSYTTAMTLLTMKSTSSYTSYDSRGTYLYGSRVLEFIPTCLSCESLDLLVGDHSHPTYD